MAAATARRLILLLAALTVLVLTAAAGVALAPAAHAAGAQNRVGAFIPGTQSLTRPAALESSCTRPGSIASTAELASGFSVATEEGPVMTPWGWSGSASYRAAVSEVANGGTLETVGGSVPSQAEAERLIDDAGGTVQRIEDAHQPPNPHQYPHINYTTASGQRGTVQIAP